MNISKDIDLYSGGETGVDIIYKEGTDEEQLLYSAATLSEARDWLFAYKNRLELAEINKFCQDNEDSGITS